MSLPRPFGAYTLMRRLAVGGMAEIYVAKTRGLGGFEKLAALKLVHPHLSADPQFIRMLIDEAKIHVLLAHANIAQVFDLGRVEDRYFIAMEYVDGIDLQGLARAAERLGKPLPVPLCCFVVAEMLNGLDYAHRKRDGSGRPLGIVHRDISPQNVVVSRAGEVKLVDFGIAKTNLRAEGTEVGVIKGKYGYMSPEQAWADPTDKRSDVFSAGVLLFELLTGSSLYSAKSVAELIAKVRRAEIPPPSTLRKEISAELSGIVMRALALEPSDRYQTALEMGDALREHLYKTGQAMSGARLGRDIVEMLEADERLSRASKRPDDTGGLRALRREEFVRNDDSLIFSLPEQAGATRVEAGGAAREQRVEAGGSTREPKREALAGRIHPPRETAHCTGSLARVITHELDELLAMPVAPSQRPTASGVPMPPKSGALESGNDDATELWTARWMAQRGGALDMAEAIRSSSESALTPIRMTNQEPHNANGRVPDSQITAKRTPVSQATPSFAPPSLSWPPAPPPSQPSAQGAAWPRVPAPPAVLPPRGEDPSLAPLPPQPAMPDFKRRGVLRLGTREIGMVLILLLLGALGAVVAWQSSPTCAVELWSTPGGARVRIDDAWQPGATPMRISGLRRGKGYRIRLELPNYKPYDGRIEANAPTSRVQIDLSRP